MPRRIRVSKRKEPLTIHRQLALTCGPLPRFPGSPTPDAAEMELLRRCWFDNRSALIADNRPEDCWGFHAFERGRVEFPELEAV